MSKEFFEDHIYDADIHIDYVTKTVKFEKQKTYKHLAITGLELASWFVIAILVIITPMMYWSYSQPVPLVITKYDTMFGSPVSVSDPITFVWAMIKITPWVFFAAFLFPLIPFLYSSSNIPAIRNIYLKSRRSSLPECILEINNPSEEIIYQTRNSDPLIDISYSKDIAEALVSASIIKIDISKKKNNTKYAHLLNIKFSRPTIGKLKIVEY